SVARDVIEHIRSLEELLELGETLLPHQRLNPGPANLVAGIKGIQPQLVIVTVTLEEQFHVLVVEVDVIVEPGHGCTDIRILHPVAGVEITVVPKERHPRSERSFTAVVNHPERLRPLRTFPHGLIQAPVDRDRFGCPETLPRFYGWESGKIDLTDSRPATESGSGRRAQLDGPEL